MRSMESMLLEFHRSFGCVTNETPTLPGKETRLLRHTLVIEELQETIDALDEKDLPEFVDGLIDTLYVAVGTNLTYGVEIVESVYGLPSEPPAFPSGTGMTLIDAMLRGLKEVANKVLNPVINTAPELPIVCLCMNKVIGDCLQTLYICGVDAMHVFAEVHLANMRKLGPDGLPIRREDGKVVKPEGWKRPDIQRVLDDQTRRFDYPVQA